MAGETHLLCPSSPSWARTRGAVQPTGGPALLQTVWHREAARNGSRGPGLPAGALFSFFFFFFFNQNAGACSSSRLREEG